MTPGSRLKLLGVAALATLALSSAGAPAAQAKLFTAAKYTALINGSSSADEFHMFGITIKCTTNSFFSELIGASEALTISPLYSSRNGEPARSHSNPTLVTSWSM